MILFFKLKLFFNYVNDIKEIFIVAKRAARFWRLLKFKTSSKNFLNLKIKKYSSLVAKIKNTS